MTMTMTTVEPPGKWGGAGQNAIPLLHTAKRLRRSLPAVKPSAAFQAGLEDELLQVAQRLARSRGASPRILVESPTSARSPATWVTLTLITLGLFSSLLLFLIGHRARRGSR
jgi:hypothetical protein